MGGGLQGESGQGALAGGGGFHRGQGTFWSSCHVLHYHMVLRPKGTSHNVRTWITRNSHTAADCRCCRHIPRDELVPHPLMPISALCSVLSQKAL